ncbi:MAG: murein L,D-transpeptidase [Deltaproteobacteria bacterium]|nr:murein L,D-transpeptidase [Deltaproteobacteria bacterium]
MPTIHGTTTTGGATGASSSTLPTAFNALDLQKVLDGTLQLSAGASGMAVMQLQRGLTRAGFDPGGSDGRFGPRTETALKQFQSSKALPATGKLDAASLKALVALSPAPLPASLGNARFTGNSQLAGVLGGTALAAGARGTGVKAVQQALDDMGFALHGGADGAFGGQTTKALKNFQRHAQAQFPAVQVTGKLDAATLRALDALAPSPGTKGQSKNLPNPVYDGKRVRVVVVKNEHRTYLYDVQGRLQAIVPNAVGAQGTATESGLKVVRTKLGEEAAAATGQRLWDNPAVFGPRIIDLSWADGSISGEELHGTAAPAQLGEDVSHGCVRHRNEDIIFLSDQLKTGDKVAVVDRLDDPRLGAPIR